MTNDEFRHSFKQAFHSSLGLAVYSCGIQKCSAGHAWGPAVRDHYLIHCVTSGKGVFSFGGKDYLLSGGDGFLLTPGVVASYAADSESPWQYCWIGFNGTDAKRLVEQTGLSYENPVFHFSGTALPDRLEQICHLSCATHSNEARVEAGLLLFLADLMDAFGSSSAAHHASGYEYVQKAARFIEYNYSRSIDVEDIAASVGISRSHLYRLFMENISVPPNEYLMRCRMNKAAALLEEGRLSVGEVASSTGFSDQLYFSRVFKKYMGIPPSQYALRSARESQKQQDNA
ncbi:AraC family transcriptional regulator [Anaeromassilibacillus sp. An200]|uniref:AraC family transcriptional regulator n=1 Tax=Candidatus Caccousia stercoris TaxID=2840723 RepID=A0A9D1FT39_9FIRM|nr:AraC family transcriptional regulator [Anaeromassilibacillus sp. An200]OUP14429.1 AraC family transcriptional regulator [Anaeromassilibacillus sp. An200]HIS78805.1 AraC family transcriptional regulator [Candidatus Caccousia stercoris]